MPSRGRVEVGVLAARIGQRPRDVLAMLGPLAVEGLVEAHPDGYRLTALGRSPAPSRPSPGDDADDGLFSTREVHPS
jgi:DNA processing protein